jgi:hypothetical protein
LLTSERLRGLDRLFYVLGPETASGLQKWA